VEKLIWFSIPGSFIVAACIISGCPENYCSENIALYIGAAVVVGFVVHQCFRCFFEGFGMFDGRVSPCFRKVIKEIYVSMDVKKHHCCCDTTAFLIWECTFYGKDFPEGFRDHDCRSWHYIISFWSCSFAAVIAAVITFCSSNNCWALIFVGVGIMLFFKGLLTWCSICKQEVLIFRRHRDLFDENEEALLNRDTYKSKEQRKYCIKCQREEDQKGI